MPAKATVDGMPRVAILHHLVKASSGHAGPAIAAAGVEVDDRRLRHGDTLPALGEVDGLLSLGGELVRRPGVGATGFRFGRCAWGVQFHPEADKAILEGWYRDWPDECAQAGVDEADARAADALHLPAQRALSEAIFG